HTGGDFSFRRGAEEQKRPETLTFLWQKRRAFPSIEAETDHVVFIETEIVTELVEDGDFDLGFELLALEFRREVLRVENHATGGLDGSVRGLDARAFELSEGPRIEAARHLFAGR